MDEVFNCISVYYIPQHPIHKQRHFTFKTNIADNRPSHNNSIMSFYLFWTPSVHNGSSFRDNYLQNVLSGTSTRLVSLLISRTKVSSKIEVTLENLRMRLRNLDELVTLPFPFPDSQEFEAFLASSFITLRKSMRCLSIMMSWIVNSLPKRVIIYVRRRANYKYVARSRLLQNSYARCRVRQRSHLTENAISPVQMTTAQVLDRWRCARDFVFTFAFFQYFERFADK